MSLLDLLGDSSVWERFYEYKTSLAVPKRFTKELRAFIDEKRYLPVCDSIVHGRPFPLPGKSVISKMGTDKKRTVYTYPADENTVLKLLTYLMLRKYDGIFSRGLYSFRPGKTAKDAVRALLKIRDVREMWGYKADIHDYFNSIPVDRLMPMLENALGDDPELFSFLKGLLTEPCVLDRGEPVRERKGIMAGTPLSSFYANLFLWDLDRHFMDQGAVYARYSDDIIIFAPDGESVREHAGYIRSFLGDRGLEINPSKEFFYRPGEPFTFLGFECRGDTVDIAPATVKKLKQKMRRKRDALARWYERNGNAPEKAAKAFIRIFNRKLLENAGDNELSWSAWFFPVINTADSLRIIDTYAQDCIRYLIYGKHTKGRFSVRYGDLKELGYRSLVHEFYARGKI
ncbi:MAG: group II intron reverse transcriptase domain-containing protein [Clostridia bacterium]|nr:group II intron reverse transcriptase domain-containing protein [Clostridia bacterium]